jgi:hypothetical protein
MSASIRNKVLIIKQKMDFLLKKANLMVDLLTIKLVTRRGSVNYPS